MAIIDECFPRGGKTKADKKEVAHYEKKRKNDNLFKDAGIKKKKKRVKKKFKPVKDLDVPLTKREIKKVEKEKTALDSIEPIAFKMLSEGMHLLGRIQEVREMDVILSLPGRMQAVVPITNISSPYSKLLNRLANNEDIDVKGLKGFLTEGQLFPCSIKEVTNDGSFKVTASLNPVDICSEIPLTALSKGMKLTAAVLSVEDHGYVMDVGMVNVRSFMAKESDQEYVVGQILSVSVTSCQIENQVATLTLSTTTSIKFKQNVELNVSTLIPGTKLHVNVKKITTRGLMVTFGNLIGYIHKDHLANTFDDMKSYKDNSSLLAVVLYTIPLVNAVYLSLKPSLVNPVVIPKESLVLGRFFDSATVLETTGAGLFLQLDKKTKGFVPLRHINDNSDLVEDLKSLYPARSRKRCRVLQHASLDDIYICTMKKSLLEQKFLRYEDFTIGELVEAKIEAVTPAGVSVKLGENLKGFIPKLHWADDPRLKRPELRFRPGESVTCRVLKVFIERKAVHLTCKKSLVEDNEPIYYLPDQLSRNLNLKGTVAMVETGGLLISFYGELTGWIPRNRLQKKGIADIARFFYVGQLVDCSVGGVFENGKVTLNLGKSDGTETVLSAVTGENSVQCLGTVVQCRVEIVFSGDQEASKGLEVSIPSLSIKAFIPIEHLSDFPKACSALLSCYQVGDIINEAVVWASSKLQTVVTLKSSIVNFANDNSFPTSIEDIEVNSVLPCVSSRHHKFGVFASLLCPPSKCDVLFHKSKLPDSLYSGMENNCQQLSIEGKVLSVDPEKKKINLSALDSDVPHSAAEILDSFFQSVEKIRTFMLASKNERLEHLASLRFGDSVIGKLAVEFNEAADLEFDISHGLKCVVPAYHHDKKKFKKNDLIAGCVLYCDLISQVVYVTTREDIAKHFSEMETLAPKETNLKARVLLNLEYFSLVSINDKKIKDIAYTSNIRNINDAIIPLPSPYSVGSEICVKINATPFGKIATYSKKPEAWKNKLQKGKRSGVTQDGPAKKKVKVNAVEETDDTVQETVKNPTTKRDKKKPSQKTERVSNVEVETNKTAVEKEAVTGTQQDSKKSKKKRGAKSKELDLTTSTVKDVEISSRPIVDEVDVVEEVSPFKKRRLERLSCKSSELPRLPVTSAFKWDDDIVTLPATATDSSDSEDETEKPEKVVVKDRRERARQKLEEAQQEEAKLSKIEESLNDPDRTPVTIDDFDRMVMASPNSSILWLQYMAFHLENAEIEKARTVAQRALKVISFREEQEKFNVWIAWLNLEHMYGTTECYDETFQEALRYNEPFKVYRQMALNFEQSGKSDEAEALHNTMLKKFKQDKSVWMNACLFYVRNSKLDTARSVFQRALMVVDKKEHIDLISRFAQLEVKFGQLERGKTLFDTLMMSYPKRTDLWLVYIDTLTKAEDIESARQVLERCITLQLPAKKMKTMFQKFLEFETHHGSEERQDYVRQKALEYVESKSEITND